MTGGPDIGIPRMRGGGQQGRNETGRLSQPAPQAFPPHPALIALARLLARSAAHEAPAEVQADQSDHTHDKD